MKFLKNLINNYNLILLLIIVNFTNYVMCFNENCKDPCLSCQSTLYYLKFRGDAECKFNRCQGLVKKN